MYTIIMCMMQIKIIIQLFDSIRLMIEIRNIKLGCWGMRVWGGGGWCGGYVTLCFEMCVCVCNFLKNWNLWYDFVAL